ncbi:hypothetical protein ABES08_10845, partial [Peribacillus simplex]|uniref:hypothetical protein n=1 Tax=Peribacillus simplex TaxID=1478 RepID=UPI003D291CA8
PILSTAPSRTFIIVLKGVGRTIVGSIGINRAVYQQSSDSIVFSASSKTMSGMSWLRSIR